MGQWNCRLFSLIATESAASGEPSSATTLARPPAPHLISNLSARSNSRLTYTMTALVDTTDDDSDDEGPHGRSVDDETYASFVENDRAVEPMDEPAERDIRDIDLKAIVNSVKRRPLRLDWTTEDYSTWNGAMIDLNCDVLDHLQSQDPHHPKRRELVLALSGFTAWYSAVSASVPPTYLGAPHVDRMARIARLL